MGVEVGKDEGTSVGTALGRCVGDILGNLLGTNVGDSLGDTEGISLGTSVGDVLQELHVAGHDRLLRDVQPTAATIATHSGASASPLQVGVGYDVGNKVGKAEGAEVG